MNFKNMKIPVENNLDEIVKELETRGYAKNTPYWDSHKNPNVVCACDDGDLMALRGCSMEWDSLKKFKLTTIAELKEM